MCRIAYKKKKNGVFLKDATGAGLVDGGVDQAPWFQGKGSGKGWLGGARAPGGGPRASVLGGVGGRGGPKKRSKFCNVCRVVVISNAYKKKKNGVF